MNARYLFTPSTDGTYYIVRARRRRHRHLHRLRRCQLAAKDHHQNTISRGANGIPLSFGVTRGGSAFTSSARNTTTVSVCGRYMTQV